MNIKKLINLNFQLYEKIKEKPDLWDLFTKSEEYNPKKLDEHGRFSYESSRHKDALFPKVSEFLINKGLKVQYPDEKRFAVVLTHDVDDIYVKNRHVFLSLLNFPKNRDPSNIIDLIKGKIDRSKTPYINFRKIIEIEKKYNTKSSFYFLATTQDIFGEKYYLEEIKEEIDYIINENCEIGLHTGYYSFDKLDEVRKEKKKIESIIGTKLAGVRNHVLRFKTPDSWELLAKAGFKYDTSFGYHDIVGFRNGMCHPFQPFNLNSGKKIDIMEIPLNIQDMTFLMHMKTNIKDCWKYIKDLIDTTERFNGVLTILWHNWTYSLPASYGGIFTKEWTKLYEKILDYSSKKNAWLTTAKEICNHYNKTVY